MKIPLDSFSCLFSLLLPFWVFAQGGNHASGKKEIILDTSLTNNCAKWEVNGVGKTRVGPFRIIEINKGETKDVTSIKSVGLFYRTDGSTSIKERMMVVLFKEQDSIFTNAIFSQTNTTDRKTLLGSMIFGADDNPYSGTNPSTFRWREMSIAFPGDTSSWKVNLCSIVNCIWQEMDLYGMLINGTDTIRLRETRGLKDVRAYRGYPTGVVFYHRGKQLAAMQFAKNRYLWMHASVEDLYRKVIGAFVATYFILYRPQ